MGKFKVGDRVVCSDAVGNSELRNQKGTVVGNKIMTSVRFDNFIGGHNCCSLCQYGYGWNVFDFDLRKIINVDIKKYYKGV